MRVTNKIMYNSMMSQVGKNMIEYNRLNEMVANERQVNRISDDPAGLASALKHRGNSSAYDQYSLNIRDAEEYLTAADFTLNHLQTILTQAREIAESAATETASTMEREIAAAQIQELINEALGYANHQMRDRYIFSGTLGEEKAYSLEGKILTPLASTNNTYNDYVESGGEYDGVGEWIVRFTQAGYAGIAGEPTTAMYQISHDGGDTWTAEEYFTNLCINIPDAEGNPNGLTLTFKPEAFGVGDEFRLQVVPGKYLGNDDHVEFNNNLYSRVNTNITGQALFEDTGFFDTLYKLKNAASYGNTLEIQEALEHLGRVETNIQKEVTTIGIDLNRLEISKNNLVSLKENVLDSIQKIEQGDLIDILMRFAMSENALNASISALSKVFPNSLLNYL